MEERVSGGGLTMSDEWVFIKGVVFNVISLICFTTSFLNTGDILLFFILISEFISVSDT